MEEKTARSVTEAEHSPIGRVQVGTDCSNLDGKGVGVATRHCACMSETNQKIRIEIYSLFENLGAKSDILSTIGSYKETQSDEAILLQLEQLNSIYGKTLSPNENP
jgi:hypothetical protein